MMKILLQNSNLQSQDPAGSNSILRCGAGPICVDFPYDAVCSELQ